MCVQRVVGRRSDRLGHGLPNIGGLELALEEPKNPVCGKQPADASDPSHVERFVQQLSRRTVLGGAQQMEDFAA